MEKNILYVFYYIYFWNHEMDNPIDWEEEDEVATSNKKNWGQQIETKYLKLKLCQNILMIKPQRTAVLA